MFNFFNNTSKGNIIVFALSTIAVMSLSATVLAASTLLELRKSRNTENAIFAKYSAESENERILYLINQALRRGHDFDYIGGLLEGMFGLNPGDFKFDGSTILKCSDSTPTLKCEDIAVTLGVNDLPFNLAQSEAFTLNMFDIRDRNMPPYADQTDYLVNRITIDWAGGATHEFEFTFVAWDKNKISASQPGAVLPPIKRRVKGTGNITFSFELGSLPGRQDTICPTPAVPTTLTPLGEMSICAIGKSTGTGVLLLGTILVKLISPGSLNGATFRLWDDPDGAGTLAPIQRQIPGFVEVQLSGKEATNKKAIRVIQNITASQMTPGKDFISEIWDYAIFSDKSISK